MVCMNIMQDASEVVSYNCSELPVYILQSDLSDYPDMKALCHWHKDIEIIYVTEGEMNYYINGKTILLREKNCVIINSQHLHYGSSKCYHDCKFICIRFHPKILNADSSVYERYVKPLIENSKIDYLSYQGDSPYYREIEEIVNQIFHMNMEMGDAYELKIISAIHFLWGILFEQCKPNILQESVPEPNDLALQKKMVSYIYEHYQDTLTLDEISVSAHISRSKCCIIFKQYMHQSPIDFLNKYRLEISRRLLLETASSVTQIAFSCGFNHLSYFSKLFFREFGCTPTEYRKQNTALPG